MAAPPSFAAMAAREQQKKAPLEKVQVEGQVILKIAQHCSQNEGTAISTGQLLGLDVGGTLEVTDCFPYPVRWRRLDWAFMLHSHLVAQLGVPVQAWRSCKRRCPCCRRCRRRLPRAAPRLPRHPPLVPPLAGQRWRGA